MIQRADFIIPECYVDTNLAETLAVQTKNVMSNKDARFKRLFKSMKDIGEMKLLESVLNYLASTTYNADDDEIVSFFPG